jgi:hypothetical protein
MMAAKLKMSNLKLEKNLKMNKDKYFSTFQRLNRSASATLDQNAMYMQRAIAGRFAADESSPELRVNVVRCI